MMMKNPLANGYGIRTKYRLVKRETTSELMVKVNELLNEGWDLQGGVATIGTFDGYVQALTREVMEKEHA